MLEISRKIIIQAFKVNQVDLALALNHQAFCKWYHLQKLYRREFQL
jgi:hypothetical protein